jgi:hypothetical protein
MFAPASRILSELKPDEIPWAGRDDLISQKLQSYSQREYEAKKRQDIEDIEAMIRKDPRPLEFLGSMDAEANKAFVRSHLPILGEKSAWSIEEWRSSLGL